jgi:hypothetical protein
MMNLLLLAALSCLQEKSPAEIFKKIEETLRNAKTVSVNYEFEELKVGDRKFSNSGTLLLKEGNKVLGTVPNQGVPGDSTFACDGRAMKNQSNLNQRDAPKNLRSVLEASLLRGPGVYYTLVFAFELVDGQAKPDISGFDADKVMPVSDVAKGQDEKGNPSVVFKVGRMEIRLWYDAKTYAPAKRVIKFAGAEDPKQGITETFKTFAVGVNIPDEKFTLTPSEK